MTGADKPKQPPMRETLADDDIATTAAWDRRTVLRTAAGAGVALAAGAAPDPAAAQGVSDRDSGPGSDPPGRGRRSAYTGRTDQDPGDPVNGGRGAGAAPRRQTGVTDRDAGAGSDPPGGGRGTAGARRTGVTDRDAGAGADPPGGGRGQAGGGQATGRNDQDYFERPWNADRHTNENSRISDNDTGQGSDPQGEGRGTAAWARRHQRQRGGASTDGDLGPTRDAIARQGGPTNLPPADLADSDNPTLPNPFTGARGNDWTTFQNTGRRVNR